MKILFLIPARSGSKRLPNKNIKKLKGKPLLCYSIDVARKITSDEHICISTDSEEIKKVVEDYGLTVPFLRPVELATDTATSNDVILHALKFYEKKGIEYDVVILLQPTSPLRKPEHLQKAIDLFNNDIDMVVSVKKSHSSSVLCKENNKGFLELIFNEDGVRSQDIKDFYEYNGSIYLINVKQFLKNGLHKLTKKKKIIMPELFSIDIDTAFDFELVEFLLERRSNEI